MNSIAGYITDHEKIQKSSVLFSFILCFIFFYWVPKDKGSFAYIFFFRENNNWYFMWVICLPDDSHQISSLIFLEKGYSIFFFTKISQFYCLLLLYLTLKTPNKTCIWKCRLFMSSAEYSCKLFKPTFAYRQTVWTQIRGAVWSGSTLFAEMTFKVTSRRQSRRQKLWLGFNSQIQYMHLDMTVCK